MKLSPDQQLSVAADNYLSLKQASREVFELVTNGGRPRTQAVVPNDMLLSQLSNAYQNYHFPDRNWTPNDDKQSVAALFGLIEARKSPGCPDGECGRHPSNIVSGARPSGKVPRHPAVR